LATPLEVSFLYKSDFSIGPVLFLLLLIAFDSGISLELPLRHRSLFWQPCNTRLLFGFWVLFAPLQLVELRLWQVSFLFISISRSWSSAHVLGLLRFLLRMYFSLFLVFTTPRVLIPIHSPLPFSLMHRVLG